MAEMLKKNSDVRRDICSLQNRESHAAGTCDVLRKLNVLRELNIEFCLVCKPNFTRNRQPNKISLSVKRQTVLHEGCLPRVV